MTVINFVHVGRWFCCAHCRVVHLGMDPNSHFCGAPWQTPAPDIPAEWIAHLRPAEEDAKPDVLVRWINLPND